MLHICWQCLQMPTKPCHNTRIPDMARINSPPKVLIYIGTQYTSLVLDYYSTIAPVGKGWYLERK